MTRLVAIVAGWWVIAWLIGAGKREASRPLYRRASWVVGSVTLFAAVGALWKWRRHVFSGVAVTVVLVGVAVVVAAWWLRPANRPAIAFVAVAAALFAAAAWDWETTGGRPWRQVCDDAKRAEQVRQAVIATHPDARPGRVVLGADETTVEVAHVGQLDGEQVGQVLHAPHVETAPTGVLGRSTVRVLAEKPADQLPIWDAIAARGTLFWDGKPDVSGCIRFGEDACGRVHVLPNIVDPSSAANVLMAGATGAGKSAGLALMLCALASQPNVAWVGLDPHRVELKPFAPRMSRVAKGPEQCYETLDWLVEEMDRRFDYFDENDLGEWRVGVDGPGILWIADELAAFEPKRSWRQLARLTAEQRKIGFGCISASQRPSAKTVELNTRDNFQVRIAFGMGSREGTTMVLDHDEDNVLRPTAIPEDLQGGYVLRLRRSRMAGRCYVPSLNGSASKADIQETAVEVAKAFAHLRVDLPNNQEKVGS